VASIVPNGRLAFGMQLQVQSKSRTFREDWEDDADSSAIAALARQADACGFFYIAVSDHLAVTKPMDQHMQTTWYDTVTTLGWLAGITQRDELPASIEYVREHRKQTIGDEPIDLGAHSDLLYVGAPTWDVGTRTVAGPPELLAERINELGAMGVDHVQVRFRSRDLREQLDQMAAFGAEVAPLLGR
jgi:alkanesulfonate monooxygenase SsuD/methylene tetrahydromethanopterin reductase-like flavin-dependent oxidoreductase (luciferase family)